MARKKVEKEITLCDLCKRVFKELDYKVMTPKERESEMHVCIPCKIKDWSFTDTNDKKALLNLYEQGSRRLIHKEYYRIARVKNAAKTIVREHDNAKEALRVISNFKEFKNVRTR